MDPKETALTTIAVIGGIGLLAVSCSDSDVEEQAHKAAHKPAMEHSTAKTTDAHGTSHTKLASAKPAHKTTAGHATHWSYEGAGAPEAWGSLKEEFSTCDAGQSQSPIDISNVTITELPDIEFDYKETPLSILNNGHTIQVNYAKGSSVTVDGKRYELLQFHFHSPSEHAVGGKYYDMVAHLVHRAADGQLGVIGVMFQEGRGINNAISKLWLNMPEKAGQVIESEQVLINAADLLPADMAYYNYSGSLTTPPCSEGVNWMVMAAPNHVAPAQVKQFVDVFPLSTRPVQPLNTRVVSESN